MLQDSLEIIANLKHVVLTAAKTVNVKMGNANVILDGLGKIAIKDLY